MPRYYCDYCDTYLTHDSPSVRTQHNAGYKHKANVRAYYQQFEEQQTQSLIDQKVKEHLGQTAAGGGTAFQQHLAALQAGQFKPPILGSAPGVQPPMVPSIRLPVLPPPTSAIPGGSSATTWTTRGLWILQLQSTTGKACRSARFDVRFLNSTRVGGTTWSSGRI